LRHAPGKAASAAGWQCQEERRAAPRSGDDAQLSAFAGRRVAHDPELRLKPGELALLGLALLLGIAPLAVCFLAGLWA